MTGKEILDPGWRVVQGKEKKEKEEEEDPERILPTFVKGESGEHKPTLTEKWTTPPPYYNEASLLRAMETAGKFVEDETLRAAMKENWKRGSHHADARIFADGEILVCDGKRDCRDEADTCDNCNCDCHILNPYSLLTTNP